MLNYLNWLLSMWMSSNSALSSFQLPILSPGTQQRKLILANCIVDIIIGHSPKLITIDEGWNIDWVINWELHLPTVQCKCLLYCWGQSKQAHFLLPSLVNKTSWLEVMLNIQKQTCGNSTDLFYQKSISSVPVILIEVEHQSCQQKLQFKTSWLRTEWTHEDLGLEQQLIQREQSTIFREKCHGLRLWDACTEEK